MLFICTMITALILGPLPLATNKTNLATAR